jgi:hypothetical protein
MVAMLAPLLFSAAGCQPGINWRGFSYDFVHADSRLDGKLTFVYFRNPYLVECTRFEDRVLSAKPVLDATKPLYCALVDFGWDRELAQKWGLDRAPAYAIVDPQGDLLASGSGEQTVDEVLDAIQLAQQRFQKSKEPPSSAP